MEQIIALLTDFGPKGQHYVAAMKAVILKINPLVKIIDISHDITPFSIIEASYILRITYKHFPKETIFIVVVDPGVGSTREIIALKSDSDYYFIGPNNGIFSNVFTPSEIAECVQVKNEAYFNHPVSSTFHGRDIMAPIGAYITKNENFLLKELGNNFAFNNLIKLPLVYELDLKNKCIKCVIQYIDSFGNGTTNIPIFNNNIKNTELFINEGTQITVKIKKKKFNAIFTSHFSSVPVESILFLVGSTGFLEISINQGNASEKLDFKVEDQIIIYL
jgi:S-adenosylmethionine hydrolase